ncbi:alpha-2-macroglobulin family protein [Parvicella tangerina]|uniref:Alpha-2-macroglobulin domain-containing protein n=1 Tax=Parvicella tangerina TaxID=2829795 RepID=A0A916NA46_9FLAO|nr:alpha-2-macroglobulin family protein [Parvicella tangerina]CAG5080107.1 hypothetical protein CRYO30217_01185 [Parvicella tangerina]
MRYSYLIIALALFFLTLTSEKCMPSKHTQPEEVITSPSPGDQPENTDPIKYEFIGDYPDRWKKIDSLNNLGLYKSALQEVNEIYELARKDKNYPQVIKAQMHRLKYNTYLTDDDYIQAIYEMDSLTEHAEFPLKQISHLLTAKIYHGFYNSNRWTIMNRTNTQDFDNKDVRTWDLRKIAQTITYHYTMATSESDRLSKVSTDDFKDILANRTAENYENMLKYRPTLLDFIGQECLTFFQSAEFGLSQSDLRCTLDDVNLLRNNKDFLKVNIHCQDSLANKIYAAQLLQQLTTLHLNDETPEALVNLTIQRLKFIKNNLTVENKEKVYVNTLDELITKYLTNPVAAELMYEKAQWFYSNRNANSQDEKEKYGYKTAHQICSRAIKLFPNSFGAKQCQYLLDQIEAKELSINLEGVMLPNTNHRYKVNHRNVDELHFKLYQLPKDYMLPYEFDKDVKNVVEQIMLDGEELKSWEETPPKTQDYESHSYEKILEGLPLGRYCLFVADHEQFVVENGKNTQHAFFQVSNFALASNNIGEHNTREIRVYDRYSGKMLSGVKVQLYEYVYNKFKKRSEYQKLSSHTTDAEGKIRFSTKHDYKSVYAELTKGEDYYFDGAGIYVNDYRYNYDNNYTTTHFFLDRKIYRPGQTIYFKGIVESNSNGNHKVIANKKITVTLYDVNYQKVKSLEVTTNEYGSYAGEFTAPDAGLNGQMRIADNYNSVYFQVEEYKRPKFQVDFDPVKGSYKLNTDVKVVGNAVAYAGNQVDGAAVKYRVVRNAYFPYWCWYKWGYQPYSGSFEVAQGEVTTDENGQFEIVFNAKEDKSVDRKFSPTYTYQIVADVTDINGETRSGQTYVSVGVNAMNLALNIPDEMDKAKMSHFKVSTTNLNGEPIDADVNITITKLKAPDQVFRTQLWDVPDQKLIPIGEYQKNFPQDVYDQENLPQNFLKEKGLLNFSVNTAENDSVNYGNKNHWDPGYYHVLAKSIDEFGEDVRYEKYIRIYDSRDNKVHNNDVLWVKQISGAVEPGEYAEFLVSSKDEIKLNYKVVKDNKKVEEKTIALKNEQKKLSFKITEEDRGGFEVYFSTVKNERSYYQTQFVSVPFTNKVLKMEFETFRNKMLPGSKEKWKVKISGAKGEKVAAEMVAAMYDASLDEFASNYFSMYLDYSKGYYYNYTGGGFAESFKGFKLAYATVHNYQWNTYSSMPYRNYPYMDMFGYYPSYYLRNGGYTYGWGGGYRGDADYYSNAEVTTMAVSGATSADEGGMDVVMEESESRNAPMADMPVTESQKEVSGEVAQQTSPGVGGGLFDGKLEGNKDKTVDLSNVKARTNFNETAFFKPHLETNSKGEIIFSFEMPESLTEWKFLSMAHTKDLSVGYLSETAITQKDLMVVPNAPRFFREGDKIVLSTKISNLTEEGMAGQVQLFLTDAISGKEIDVACKNVNAQQSFRAEAKQSTSVEWELEIPMDLQALTYKIVAKAGDFSDGEEMTLPVLTNRMMVTESIPLYINKKGEKTFKLQNLIDSEDSETLTHHKLTIEYTSNPAWYAVQALPYMMEYPYECAEQTFSRYYANAIAAHIVDAHPKIEKVFEEWKNSSPEALLSNLEKNQELKSLILEETPWVLNAKSESESKKRIALLFDMHKMKKELNKAMKKLRGMQLGNGAFPWFHGMNESRYITQHIVCGMGHLNNLGVINSKVHFREWQMIKKAMYYLDMEVLDDYEYMLKHYPNYKDSKHISYTHLHWLYARSYFDFPVPSNVEPAYEFYLNQAKKYWHTDNLMTEAMTALLLERLDEEGKVQDDIMKSLSELAIHDEEMGMYYKRNLMGYYWYQAPIETQALLIEAFDEVAKDDEAVEELKVWLLKQKQTTHWKTTRATAEACYALLLRGTDILANDEIVEVKLGDMKVEPSKTQAGTGYFKESYQPDEIKPDMGNVTVTKQTDGVSWGGLYWQYFENLDKIKTHESPLAISKQLFIVQLNENGEYMTPIKDGSELKVGDKVRVRIEIHTDRDLEYVHLKDMRAAGFEPVNVVSRYKWQDGLGYYESTKDASTNFFMDYLSKGTYVFEYDLKVFHKGDFSNGITTMQCMYAPEFSSHSEGVRVVVE